MTIEREVPDYFDSWLKDFEEQSKKNGGWQALAMGQFGDQFKDIKKNVGWGNEWLDKILILFRGLVAKNSLNAENGLIHQIKESPIFSKLETFPGLSGSQIAEETQQIAKESVRKFIGSDKFFNPTAHMPDYNDDGIATAMQNILDFHTSTAKRIATRLVAKNKDKLSTDPAKQKDQCNEYYAIAEQIASSVSGVPVGADLEYLVNTPPTTGYGRMLLDAFETTKKDKHANGDITAEMMKPLIGDEAAFTKALNIYTNNTIIPNGTPTPPSIDPTVAAKADEAAKKNPATPAPPAPPSPPPGSRPPAGKAPATPAHP